MKTSLLLPQEVEEISKHWLLPGEGSSSQKRVCSKMYSIINKIVWKQLLIFAGIKLRYSLASPVFWSLAIMIVQSCAHLRNLVHLFSFGIDFFLCFREACTLCESTQTRKMKLNPSLKCVALRRKEASVSWETFHSLEQGDLLTVDLKANQVMHRYWRLKWMHQNKTWSVFCHNALVAGLVQMLLFLQVT